MPKFMFIFGANADSEAGRTPKTEDFDDMLEYNKNLVDAGVMLAGEGLLASSRGAKITFSHSAEPSVQRGAPGAPLGEPQHLIAGWWLVKCKDLDEAIDWAKKAPIKIEGQTIQVRQVASDEDFGDALTEAHKQAEAEMRAKLGEK